MQREGPEVTQFILHQHFGSERTEVDDSELTPTATGRSSCPDSVGKVS